MGCAVLHLASNVLNDNSWANSLMQSILTAILYIVFHSMF